jgi:hypothetical protein
VENHGQPEAPILDIADYYILLAAAHYLTKNGEGLGMRIFLTRL